MKLPDHQLAVIPKSKIVDYLLSETHSKGKFKAAFFERFGFTKTNWEIMVSALVEHAAANEVSSILITERGKNYSVEGILITPDRRNPFIRSVWAIDADGAAPRFITAYPVEDTRQEND
jgi:Domain of unknown function (DUF6883)